MIEILDTQECVLAAKVGGKLKAAELDALVDKLDASLEACEQTHIFVEVDGFSGLELDAVPRYLPRAGAMLGKLKRFGRIAVVAEQSWVRWVTRIESALLPGISYEVFTPSQRDHALAWVEGREARSHPPSLKIIETDKPEVLGFELDGRLSADELAAVAAVFAREMDRAGAVRILGRIRNLDGIEPSGLFNSDYYRMKLAALQKVERYALVGGPGWLRHWVGLFDSLMKMEAKHFEADEENAAWAWIGAHPTGERLVAG